MATDELIHYMDRAGSLSAYRSAVREAVDAADALAVRTPENPETLLVPEHVWERLVELVNRDA